MTQSRGFSQALARGMGTQDRVHDSRVGAMLTFPAFGPLHLGPTHKIFTPGRMISPSLRDATPSNLAAFTAETPRINRRRMRNSEVSSVRPAIKASGETRPDPTWPTWN